MTILRLLKLLAVVPALLFVVACAPGSSTATDEPGAEASSDTSPAAEDTSSPDNGGDTGGSTGGSGGGTEVKQVSVDLPGLPIGGNGAFFTTDEPTQCVDVNWTGPPLPDGVALQFTAFHVPPEFTWDSTPCSDSPCVGRAFRITNQTGGCTVSVTWNGQPVADRAHSALHADATAFCADSTTCDGVRAAADALNGQTDGGSAVGLDTPETGDTTGGSSGTTDNSSSGPSDGSTAGSSDGPAASPSDGISGDVSPSGSSGG
ncbi:MAG: hypothetical protein QOK15_3421 [Nocardioidaceae bacterium]|nr:hypothetical protein [Nocardioidaceae bacterium]